MTVISASNYFARSPCSLPFFLKNYRNYKRFKAFTATKIPVVVFWAVRFRGPCCLHLQIAVLPQHCTASQPTRPQLEP